MAAVSDSDDRFQPTACRYDRLATVCAVPAAASFWLQPSQTHAGQANIALGRAVSTIG